MHDDPSCRSNDDRQIQRHILTLCDLEKKRLGQDIHDGIGQQLTGIRLLCKALQQRLRQTAHTVIGSGVRIVSQGNVDFKQQATLREQTEVFTMQDILFRQAGTTTEGTTLIAMGNIVIQQQMDFKGILYSEGTIEVAQNANLEGTLIARDGFEIKSNITVKYNPDVFANPNPLPFFSWVLTTRRQWEQNPLHNILF